MTGAAVPFDVVIPFHGRLELLARCLGALARNAPIRGSVYLVDDGTPGSETVGAARLPDTISLSLRRVRLERRSGFVAAVNHVWKLCTQPITLILNNDTLVTADLVERLHACLRDDGRVSAVAPASDNRADLFQFRHAGRGRGTTDVPYLTAASLAVRRAAVGSDTLFDPVFSPGYFEDLDLSCRLRAQGSHLRVVEACRVHHAGRATFRHDPGLPGYLQRNYRIFVERWGHLDSQPALERLLGGIRA